MQVHQNTLAPKQNESNLNSEKTPIFIEVKQVNGSSKDAKVIFTMQKTNKTQMNFGSRPQSNRTLLPVTMSGGEVDYDTNVTLSQNDDDYLFDGYNTTESVQHINVYNNCTVTSSCLPKIIQEKSNDDVVILIALIFVLLFALATNIFQIWYWCYYERKANVRQRRTEEDQETGIPLRGGYIGSPQ